MFFQRSMKLTGILLILLLVASSCSTLHSLNDLNCKLGQDRSKNFIGKWKVISNDKKFIWRFYSDNTTATLQNEYLTQLFGKDVYVNSWKNTKIDTLSVYFTIEDQNSSKIVKPRYKIDYFILSNECRRIEIVNVKTLDTLVLKRKQYFYQ